jgi:hypothetical protein
METCCEYLDDKVMWVSSDQQKIINRVRKLAETYPDSVAIKRQPEQNDGCIYATMPADWLKLNPPRKIELTDERKAELSERLRTAREIRANNSVSSGCTEYTL